MLSRLRSLVDSLSPFQRGGRSRHAPRDSRRRRGRAACHIGNKAFGIDRSVATRLVPFRPPPWPLPTGMLLRRERHMAGPGTGPERPAPACEPEAMQRHAASSDLPATGIDAREPLNSDDLLHHIRTRAQAARAPSNEGSRRPHPRQDGRLMRWPVAMGRRCPPYDQRLVAEKIQPVAARRQVQARGRIW